MNILKRKSTQYILLALIVIAVGLGIYGYKEYNRTAKDIALVNPSFTITSNTIINDFTKNDSIANTKYLGKTIALSGNLKAIDKDENGFFTLVLGDTSSTTSVRCSMDSVHNNEAASLKEGNQINIKGICTGYNKDEMGLGADIILNHSCINKTQ
jgi:tRNA_anti-like